MARIGLLKKIERLRGSSLPLGGKKGGINPGKKGGINSTTCAPATVTQEHRLALQYALAISTVFNGRGLGGRVVASNRGARYLTLGVGLYDAADLAAALGLGEQIALQAGVDAVLVQRHRGIVAYQVQLSRRYWRSYTRAAVKGAGVGIAGGGRQIDFAYDGAGGAPHAGVFGTTGSGKTVTIQSILAGQLVTYTPDELGVVILDPHRDFEAFGHSAHLVAPIAHTLDDIADAARLVDAELARRTESNERGGRRWLVVVDEATRALARESEQIVVRAVVSEARKFKINLLLGAQNAAEKELPGIVRLVNNRFVGLVANAQVSSQLTGQAGLEAHKLTGAGDFLHVVGADIARLQVAMATDEDLAALPRVVEVPRPTVAPVDTPAALNLEPPSAGRPAIDLEGRHLAAYLHHGVDGITEQQARDVLALKRKAHRLHRDYAGALVWLEQLERRYAMDRYPSPVDVARCMVHSEDVRADVSAEAREVADELLAGLAYLRETEEAIDDATRTE